MQLFRLILPMLAALSLFFTSFPAIAAPAVLPGLQGVFTGNPPTDIGVQDAQLQTCPESPNCVSSTAGDEDHFIAPIAYTADRDAVRDKLIAIIKNQPRTEIIDETDDYIRAEFTSRLMGFVDDAEFYFLPDTQEIALRSAARLGESDLGVNRRRLEQFRLALQSLGA
ncbi:MAG: DUF1499 domain-containing protein [Cyanobacteria bacterium P01_D01_bin.156]